jgi:hypothetical protein
MKFTPERKAEVIELVCAQLEEKRFLSQICSGKDAPCGMSTFLRWVAESDEVRERYARARGIGITKLLEENIAISDEAVTDAYIAYDNQGKPYAKLDGDCVRRAALRISTRERFAQLMAPERYGNRIDVTSGGKALPAPQSVTLVDNRVNALLVLAAQRMAEGGLIDARPADDIDDIMS